MRARQISRVAVLCSVLGLVALSGLHQAPGQLGASCQHSVNYGQDGMVQLQLECAPVRQQSWSDWLAGNSYSTQFHFIDLLELLNRLHSKHDND